VAIPLIVLIVLLAVGGYLTYRYFDLQGDIGVPPDITDEDPPEGKPFNALLVGSDSREGLTPEEQERLGADDETPEGPITGERADTLILAHVDPATDRVTMVQFPRDLYVPLAGGGRGKIASALEDGKQALVNTVKNLTGLSISKYVQINIAGFRDLVDAIDGVDVCIPEPIPFDAATGIQIKRPGMIHFDGDRAIRFVRSRKVFAEGDLARIQNQQKFISAAIDKIASTDTIFHLGRINALVEIAGKNLRTSETPLGLLRLARRFRSFDPRRLEAYTAPNLGPVEHPVAGSIVAADRPAMRVMWEAIAENRSPADADEVPGVDPDDISVGVYNGTYEEGIAAAAARKLARATTTSRGSVDIDPGDVTNADRFDYRRTLIRYDRAEPGAKRKAMFVAAAVPGAKVERARPDEIESDVDVAVIVGRRPFRTKQVVLIEPLPIPKPGALPAACRT
jgi:LCP family protein required for cell wall assembly